MRELVEKWVSGLTAPARRGVELRHRMGAWEARLTNQFDAETDAFEVELLARDLPALVSGGPTHRIELPIFQRLTWLRASKREYRIMQLRDAEGRAAMQIAMQIERPRRMPMFGRAMTPKLGPGISAEAEHMGLQILHQLALEAGDLVSLRLQPYRRDAVALRDFQALANREGFELVDPIAVARTLVIDLQPSADELLAWVSKKTRAKIRHKSRSMVELRELRDARWLDACAAAANASLERTRGGETRFDFEAAFALAERGDEHIRIVGVFLPEQPEELLAYVIGFRHGTFAEYCSAGSLNHPVLRTMPFNYWLLWELIGWARDGGAKWLDLGGITDGGPGDTRAGISEFKRHFSDTDAELGRELSIDLQPTRAFALSLWQDVRSWHAARQRDEGLSE